MILDCIRHGVTASNLAGRFNDSENEGLAAERIDLFERAFLDAASYDMVFVSTLRRCVETAERLGLREWISEARIAELRFGIFKGLTPAQCEAKHPEAFRAFSALDADYAHPGGESRAEHLSRVSSWLEETARLSPRRVLAITHGGVIDFLYRTATDHPLHGGGQIFAGANLARSRFEVDWPRLRLIIFNEPLVATTE